MHRLVFACIVLALMGQVGWAEGQTASEGSASASDTEFDIPFENAQNNDAFNVIVIGDSIAWGTGLNKNEKYSYLIADWLKTQMGRPVHVKILAHTGATIDRVPCDSTSPTDYPPELSSGRPTLMEQADMIPHPKEVDLILVSGGANDVNLDKLLMLDYGRFNEIDVGCWKFPIGSTLDDIRKRSEDIKNPMSKLLTKLLDECPHAKIIVTGYYSGVSQKSEGLTEAVAALVPISQNPITKGYKKLGEKAQKDQLVTKSALFRRVSGDSLEKATKDTNDNFGTNRVAFAGIFFPPERCYGTDQSWLWKIDNSNDQVRTNDNMFAARVALLKRLDKYCECEPCVSESTSALAIPTMDSENARSTLPISSGIDCNKYLRDKLDAVGHPNVEGAGEYNRTIVQKISETWPDWLHPIVLDFQVSPPSLTSGESVKITYKVSSNCSEGLQQVELWRKNETSNWKEIEPPNTLAGETGPVSGSFTDSPSAPGKYWYGVHVVDKAGNWNDQKNSNTGGQPSGFEPAVVEVKGIATAKEMSQAPSEDWNRTFGGDDLDEAHSVQPTSDGGYILAGRTESYGHGQEAWLIKTDSNGQEIWNRTYPYFVDSLSSVYPTPDGGYILAISTISYGAKRDDALLIKTDSNGQEIWNRTLAERTLTTILVQFSLPTATATFWQA